MLRTVLIQCFLNNTFNLEMQKERQNVIIDVQQCLTIRTKMVSDLVVIKG